MPSDTDKLIAETLLMFASARTQLEGGRALLEQARATLVKVGGCDDEIHRIHRSLEETSVVLMRLDHKIRYVSNLTPDTVRADVALERIGGYNVVKKRTRRTR